MKELEKYNKLNELAELGGIVIFGGNEDKEIPTGEISHAFGLEENVYNRSIEGLSVINAVEAYKACVAPIKPETLLIHIGKDDLELICKRPEEFDNKYRELIACAENDNRHCRVVVVSLINDKNDEMLDKANTRLKYIAESERCSFADISHKRAWNPKSTKAVAEFVYSVGFVRPLRIKRPIYDLVKMMFCCEA